jgi:hypothetical protein
MSTTCILICLAVIIILILMFNQQICDWIASFKNKWTQMSYCPSGNDDDLFRREHINNPKIATTESADTVNSTLDALGYTADAPWDAVLQATELDPSTYANHMDYVKDVRRFSSGANFTSVTDDNTNLAFTNFVGLRRPEHVPIGASARQTPDIDETVLQRNRPLRW